MKGIKRFISFVLVICMLASVSPAAYAVEVEHELAFVSAQGSVATTRLLAEGNCSLFAAQYAEDGQLLSVSTAEVPGKDGWQTVSIPLQETEEDFDLKVFLLDRDTKAPLSDSYVLKHAGTASERYSIVGVDAEPEAIVATVTTDEACTMEVQVWDQNESKLLFTTTAAAAEDLNLEYVSAKYTGDLPNYFILRAVLKDEDGNAVSNAYVNRHNTESFQKFASRTEADYSSLGGFIDVGEPNDGNFMVLSEDVTRISCSEGSNTFAGENNGVLTFNNAGTALTTLKPGDLFAFQNADGQYETVKIKEITVNNGVVTITRDEDVYLADFYAVVKINADLTYEGEEEDVEEVSLMSASEDEKDQLLKIEFGPAVKTNVKLGIGSVEGKLRAGGKVTINYNPEELGEDYMDVAVVAGFKGEMKVTLGLAKEWKDSVALCSIPLAGVKEALGASLDAELVCQIDSEFGYNFTLEAETCYGFTYSTDTGGQVLKEEHFTQKDATSESKLAGHAEIEIGIRGGLKLSLLDGLVSVSAGAEGGLVLSGDLEILADTLPVNTPSYHACNLCINGDVRSYFEIDTTVDYKINRWLSGTILDLDLFRIEMTLGSFYLSLFSDADSVHEGEVVFGWADSCPNKKYRVSFQTFSAYGDEVEGCTVAVFNKNNNSDTLTTPGKTYLYPGTYTAKTIVGQNHVEKAFTVKDAPITVRLTGQNKVISGWVTDFYTNEVLSGATVEASPVYPDTASAYSTKADKNGWYELTLPDGEYRVIFSAEGYESQTYPLTLTADKALDAALESEPYTIHFDANGGNGIMDDMEFHHGQTITLPICIFTPPEGKTFRGWLLGDVICSAGTAYEPGDGDFTLTAVWMEKSYIVTVTVLNTDGSPVSGQAIAGTGLATAPVTGSGGTVTFELAAGTYQLSATDSKNNYASAEIDLTKDTAVTLTLKEPTIEWSFDEATGTLTITGNGGPMPNYPYAYSVPWAEHRAAIKAVELSDVTTIGSCALSYCESLTSIDLPDGVTSIDANAFSFCRSLSQIVLPDSVTSIGTAAFLECESLPDITLPDSVSSIGFRAFSSCRSLTSIDLPENLTEISNAAFDTCTSLASVSFPDGLTKIYDKAFVGCSSLTSIDLPDSVSYIAAEAFYACTALTSIDFSDNLTKIGADAFVKCDSLASVTLPASLTSIGANAFRALESLNDVTFQSNLTEFGNSAFELCTSLTSITFYDDMTRIGSYAFSGCTSLTSVTLPESLEIIGYQAFGGCTALAAVTFPDGLQSVSDNAFYECEALANIDLPDSVTKIGQYAFYGCKKVTSVNLPDSLTSIGLHAFGWCESLVSIDIPDGLKTLGGFAGTALTSVIVPAGVTGIAKGAFDRCKSLKSITLPDGLEGIGAEAFYECDSLAGITIPDSVRSIGIGAFLGCDSLTSITLPASLTEISKESFGWCSALTSITIPDGVTKILGSAFKYCTSLTNVTIPDSVTKILGSAFAYCTSLTSVTIPVGAGIYEYAFDGCKALTDVYYAGSAEEWAEISISSYGNDALKNATIHYKQ